MIKRWLLALALFIIAAPAWAQNPQCPTRSVTDDSNACASTAFVQDIAAAISGGTSVKTCGALGNSNGTTGNGANDTSTIQTCIDNNDVVYFPCGIYRINATLTASVNNKRYFIYGYPGCTSIYNDAATSVPTLQASPGVACSSASIPCLHVAGITFITPTSVGAGNIAIQIANNQHAVIENNTFIGYRLGLSIATSYGIQVVNNNLYSIRSNAILSSSSDASFNAGRISGNTFFGNGTITSDAAVNIGTTTGGLFFVNNVFDSNYAGAIFNGGHEGVTLQANYLENQTSFDFWWNDTNYGFLISANRIGSGLTTVWGNIVNSRIENNIIGGAGGTISCSNTTALGNWVLNNRQEGGATFSCVDGSGTGTSRYSGLMVFSNTINATGANTGAVQIPSGGLWVGGQVVISGNLLLPGFVSGVATITQQSAAGTPTLTLPTATGTFVTTTASPLAISATTGQITCATCATTAGANIPSIAQGDLLYGSATNALSALAKNTGASRFLKNSGTNNNPTWVQPAASDLSDGTSGTGAVALVTSPTFITSIFTPAMYGGTAQAATLTIGSSSHGTPTGNLVIRGGNAAALTVDQFQQVRFGSAALFPNNNGIYFDDSGGTSRSVFFMSAANVAIVKVASSGSTLQFQDTGFNPMLTIADGGTAPIKFASSGSFIANAAVATVLGSVGPTGSNTTVQEWLRIQNASGTVRYIPMW